MSWKEKLSNAELSELYWALSRPDGPDPITMVKKMARLLDEAEKQKDAIEEVYLDRNLLALLAGRLATRGNMNAGLRSDPECPDYPILYIDLPTGQVSWHVSAELIDGLWAMYSPGPKTTKFQVDNDGWDGHTVAEKRGRIRKFIQ